MVLRLSQFCFYCTIFFALALASIRCGSNSSQLESPNIVLILTDDQGWGDLSINGNRTVNTPNIDAIGMNGALFENFYVQPVCSPTRAEILTGRYSARSGVYATSAGGERIDLDETTLAEVLRKNDYVTGCFGKWHCGMQYPYHPLGRGFDEFYGFASGHWGNYFSPMLEHNGRMIKGEGYLSDDLTSKALDFIEKNKDRPFFAYLPLNIPHSPMSVPDELWAKWENIEILQSGTLMDQEDLMKTRAALAMCENIDHNVGRVQSKLKELGLEENTILIYLSDNGPNGHRWNGGMSGVKGSTDEGGVKSPLLVQWKGQIEPNTRISNVSGAIDLLPTIASLTRSKIDSDVYLDGIDLSRLLKGYGTKMIDRYLFNHWRGQVSVRSQKFRLDKDNHLYDLESDKSQNEPVTGLYPEVYSEHLDKKEWFSRYIATKLLLKDDRPFLLGHPDFHTTQIPARDGISHGDIERSNRWPNCSFFTNWRSESDSITWNIEVVEAGEFEVQMYYTLAEEGVGSEMTLQCGSASLSKKIENPHDPPLIGMEYDRGKERGESYVKDFKPIQLGKINLSKGRCQMVLKSDLIIGSEGPDFRLFLFEKV